MFQKSLEMGDEMCNRQISLTLLMCNEIMNSMLRNLRSFSNHEILQATHVLSADKGGGGPRAIIGITMAAAKAILEPAQNIQYSTIVTSMCRNGYEWGIQVSGTGSDLWFTAPSVVAQTSNYHINPSTGKSYQPHDRGLDHGDSSLHEAVGWGGMSLVAASQSFLKLLGLNLEQAYEYNREMKMITTGSSEIFQIPCIGSTGLVGIPLGIDVIKVVKSGYCPIIDTGIPHKNIGHSIIGRGIVRAPMECFEKSLSEIALKYGMKAEDLL